MGFTRAQKRRSKLRLALCGPTGSGKTYSALSIAQGLGKRVALIDTECGSASLYADRFEFDVLELDSGHPEKYIEAIEAAEEAGYDVLVIDSLSHAWMGKDGALELVDKAGQRSRSKNSFAAWREVTPLHNCLVDKLVRCKCHLICTMRSKMSYEIQPDDRGRKVPVKIGLEPMQRSGMEYEFTLVGDLDLTNTLIVSKTRCSQFAQAVLQRPSADFGKQLLSWLEDRVSDARAAAEGLLDEEARRNKARAELTRLKEVLGAVRCAELTEGMSRKGLPALEALVEALIKYERREDAKRSAS